MEEQIRQGHEVSFYASGDSHASARLVSWFPRALREEGVPWQAHLKAYYHLHTSLEHARSHELVHTHLSSATDMYLFPLLAALPTPHVTTLHGNFPFDRVPNWVGDADDLFLEWAATLPIVTVSEKARTLLPASLHCVGVVHLGLAMRQYRWREQRRERFFAWLGRFVPEKGPHLAIAAAQQAGVPLVLAGTIDSYNGEQSASYFQQHIQPWLDNEQVTYIGPVDLDQKRDLLRRAWGFLNPIQFEEPGATVILEAMALGCPVISFARGVAPELILHGMTGFLVETVEEMASAMTEIAALNRYEVHQHVARHFSAQVMAEKYLAIYSKLL